MARARTSLDASSGWTCTFRFPIYCNTSFAGASMPVGGALGALGGMVTVATIANFAGTAGTTYTSANVTGDNSADVVAAINAWDAGCNAGPPPHGTSGTVIAASARIGMGTVVRELFVVGTWAEMVSTPYVHFVYHFVGQSEVVVNAAVSMTNIHRDEAVFVDPELEDRNPLDWSYWQRLGAWIADEDSVMTVSANSATATGSFPYPGEMDLGDTDFRASATFSPVALPTGNAVWGRIEDLAFFGHVVSLAGLDLYKPGTASTDPNGDGWCRTGGTANCARVVADGSDMTYFHAGTYNTAQSWTGTVSALTTVNFKELPNDWYTPNATVTGPVIEWSWNGSAWVSNKLEWAGSHTANQQYSSWLWAWERQCFDALDTITISATDDWREANGEDVGGSNPAQNDAQAGVLCHPISASSRVGEDPPWWGPMLTLAHIPYIDVSWPAESAGLHSYWEAVAGVRVDESNTSSWYVQPGATNPQVDRTYKTRYWLRLENLQGYAGDPELPRNFDWPIICRPNQYRLEDIGDAAAWATSVPDEDEWHWAQYSTLRVYLQAPKAGTVTLRVDYSTVNVSDPCYSSVEWRADEFSYTRTQHVASYTVAVEAGDNDIYIDLACPNENFVPTGSLRMHHVDKLTLTLPASSEVSEEERWDLGLLYLVEAPTDSYAIWRFKREWMWSAHKSFGFGALVDGLPALQLRDAYGYDHCRNEDGLVYIQFAQHDPDSEATGDPCSSKPLARLFAELNWQRGWTTTWPAPEATGYNEDADGNRLKGTFDWWELKPCEVSGESPLVGCVTVGTWDIVQGIEQDVWYLPGPPRGRVHGLAKSTSGDRMPNLASGVLLYGRDMGGAWTLVEDMGTDAQGRFVSGPLKELNREYRVKSTGLTVVNREYSWATWLQSRALKQGVAMFSHPCGLVPWTVWISGASIYIVETMAGYATLGTVQTVDTSGNYDCVFATTDGATIYVDARRSDDETLWRFYSTDKGETWTGPVSLA